MPFLRNGKRFTVNDGGNLETIESLDGGNYIVNFDTMSGAYFLEKIDDFPMPDRIYGNLSAMADRVATTYSKRATSTGALFSGEKGSGKSLLCKIICARAAERGIPTIIVASPWAGEVFNQFIQKITQECIVVFDEFEKTYNEPPQQEALLTLLDGTFPTRKLFLLTCNNKYKIDMNMTNRPGRLFYNIEFKGLETFFIEDYCKENLIDKSQLSGLLKVCSIYENFNFDMLKALVEEMNRYSESAAKAVAWLNIKPIFNRDENFKPRLEIDGVEMKVTYDTIYLDPFSAEETTIFYEDPSNPAKPVIDIGGDDEEGCKRYSFSSSDLVEVVGNSGEYKYRKGNSTLTLRKVDRGVTNFDRLYAC